MEMHPLCSSPDIQDHQTWSIRWSSRATSQSRIKINCTQRWRSEPTTEKFEYRVEEYHLLPEQGSSLISYMKARIWIEALQMVELNASVPSPGH